ncbi:hypothetical protein [Streptomyces phaeofaciens]|uniref:hypothetical protein n=1 Tax=Streptomyces phaeofaciens TaxID=68254 RepID=UPI00357134A7
MSPKDAVTQSRTLNPEGVPGRLAFVIRFGAEPFLHDHKALREEMPAAAGELWQEHRVVFSRPDGRPLDPRADYEEFKELLTETGIDDHRLYDGSRDTTETLDSRTARAQRRRRIR